MQQINVVLVLLNPNALNLALQTLNFANANLITIVMEDGDNKILNTGDKKIPLMSFASMQPLLNRGAEFVWLINGHVRNVSDIWKMKKFLLNAGVSDDNIVNFEIMLHLSVEWMGNLRHVEKFGADFFATGISYTEVGLDLNFIPHLHGRGVNLSGSNQDLSQGYLTAKYIFSHVPPGTIKFVLIGLTPYSFRYDNAKAFAVCSRHLQYMLAVDAPERNLHDRLLKILVSDNVQKIFANITAAHADLNFDRVKNANNRQLPAIAVIDWEVELKNLTKKFFPDTVEKNLRVLEDYIKLCRDNGAEPVGVVFPFAPTMHDNYSAELLSSFRLVLRHFKEHYNFTCVDMFDLPLGYENFYNMAHLNLRGASTASSLLSLHLYNKNFLATENFCTASYAYFDRLSYLLERDDYNAMMDNVFRLSAERLRRKSKLKIGFVLYDASMWCGDELYNFFAADERFEPTIFLCRRTDRDNELVRKDFLRGVEQFTSRGLNVVALPEKNSAAPAQDILIYLTPYFHALPDVFYLYNLTAQTLVTYIPYAFDSSCNYNGKNLPILHLAWKIFLHSDIVLNYYDRLCHVGVARGVYSGYPKTDSFFYRNADLHFDWKMIRPDAKKIIWAPHWSINDGVFYSTFQWNYKFMYEFAAAHPETSWVVKPHPNLLYSAVNEKIFPDADAFNDYLDAWNNLPNAKVVTGGYYQGLFATGDGMIHDSGSFIAEYQYVDKPMIYLTRDTQRFNDLGNKILPVSYCVDGRDLNAIAELMQRVFIAGDDYKAAARRKFFDANLNYVKQNGCTASEFIYKTISQNLNFVPEI